MFASSAATAVAAAQSASAEQHRQRLASAERARGRWARELHDETLHGLAALRIGLAAANRAGTRDALQDAVIAAIDQLEGDISVCGRYSPTCVPRRLTSSAPRPRSRRSLSESRATALRVDVQVDLVDEDGRSGARHTPELEIGGYPHRPGSVDQRSQKRSRHPGSCLTSSRPTLRRASSWRCSGMARFPCHGRGHEGLPGSCQPVLARRSSHELGARGDQRPRSSSTRILHACDALDDSYLTDPMRCAAVACSVLVDPRTAGLSADRHPSDDAGEPLRAEPVSANISVEACGRRGRPTACWLYLYNRRLG